METDRDMIADQKTVGFQNDSLDIFNKGSRKGVDIMRARINHRKAVKQGSVDKNFWEEYKQRGFKLDSRNDGTFHAEIKNANFTQKGKDTYEVVLDEKVRFNIVPASTFMKTVSQIEGLVKYKLFK